MKTNLRQMRTTIENYIEHPSAYEEIDNFIKQVLEDWEVLQSGHRTINVNKMSFGELLNYAQDLTNYIKELLGEDGE